MIAAPGTTARGSHVTSSTLVTIGSYRVIFDHNVSKCAFTATLGTTGTNLVTATGEITVAGAFLNKNGVAVQILNRSGTHVSIPFHLAVDCGATKDIGVINSDGSKARGAHVVSSARLSSGRYEVIFDRNVAACAYTATIGETGNAGEIDDSVTITTARRSLNTNGVFVFIHNVSGVTQDEPFHLKVTC